MANKKAQKTEGLSEAKTEVRDPVLDKEVTFTMKVEQVNILLNLLGELPYVKSASAIEFFRGNALQQIQEAAAESEDNTEKAE